jgi:hypothetical protein
LPHSRPISIGGQKIENERITDIVSIREIHG